MKMAAEGVHGHTGVLKLSGSCLGAGWQKTRLQSNMAAEMEVFPVSQ